MQYLVIILLIVVIIFGVASGMQSYATAQQAQAQIEVAKVAQVNALGNLIVIMALFVVLLAILAIFLYWLLKGSGKAGKRKEVRRVDLPEIPNEIREKSGMDQLVALMTLKALMDLRGTTPGAVQLPAAKEDKQTSDVEDLFPWLR